MKKILFSLIASTFILSVKAQKVDTIRTKEDDDKIFAAVEHPPEFPGGQSAFNHYLQRTIRYPGVAAENRTQGRVILSLIVEKDGSLSSIKVVHSVSPEIDAEALRVMSQSPKWKPAMQNGHLVRMFWSVPISFTLAN